MATRAQPQLRVGEELVEDAELEDLLERRQAAKETAAAARKAYGELDDEAKGELRHRDLIKPTPVRIGRFVISERSLPARAVSFETEPSSRLAIVAETDDEG